mmetsp:Transcript_23837/g.34962  ORF Transcript_23837/g.34962 Transcript_23837/m.34962 type:complete len:371 (-) Transcript_23837:116-1228(-)
MTEKIDRNTSSDTSFLDNSEEIYTRLGPHNERFDDSLSISCKGNDSVSSHQLRIVRWLPASDPVGIVLISHGLHEHALRYYNIAHALTVQGVGVYACDHYGHGKSDGIRGLIPDYNIIVSDFIEFAQYVRREHPDIPFSLLSHSMGTLVGILSIGSIPFLNAVVFSATPLHSGPSASSPFGCTCLYPLSQTSVAGCLTGCLASCAPTGPAAPILLDGITSDRRQQQILLNDNLRYGGEIMNKTASEVLKMIHHARETLPTITLPLLCIHGQDDTVALPDGSQVIYDLAGTPAKHKTVEIIANLRHELLHEVQPASEQCLNRIAQYLLSSLSESLQNETKGEGEDIRVEALSSSHSSGGACDANEIELQAV